MHILDADVVKRLALLISKHDLPWLSLLLLQRCIPKLEVVTSAPRVGLEDLLDFIVFLKERALLNEFLVVVINFESQ